MKLYNVPHSTLSVSSVVLGMMRIKDMSDKEIDALFHAAIDAGVNMIDHADIYGGKRHVCEARFGDAVKLTAAQREKLIIQSKVGIVTSGPYFDFSKENVLAGVDGSLKAMKTEYMDVLLLHRPDTLMEPEEIAEAFDKLHAAGKVRHFGVSNQTPGQIELLKSAVKQPLLFNQVQFSIAHANLVTQGIAVNMGGLDQSIDRDLGLLDYSRLKGMMLQAWSPFQKGFFEGVFIGDRKDYAALNDVLDELAKTHKSTPTGIATAWIIRHPANIQVIAGTTNAGRIKEMAAASDIRLSREEWYRIFRAAGHVVP